MLNDPDCGWVDSGPHRTRRKFPPSDGLKSLSILKKTARRLVLEDAQFEGHYIVEIIPFLPSRDSDHILQMTPKAISISFTERGMLTVLDDFNSGRDFVSRVNYMIESGIRREPAYMRLRR